MISKGFKYNLEDNLNLTQNNKIRKDDSYKSLRVYNDGNLDLLLSTGQELFL